MTDMKKIQDLAQRIMALFLSSALAIITGSALIGGIPVWKSAALAGFTAIAKVVESLAKASIDGTLTKSEIDGAFGGSTAKKSPKIR
jgi:hypothetical protein